MEDRQQEPTTEADASKAFSESLRRKVADQRGAGLRRFGVPWAPPADDDTDDDERTEK